jgi:flagellar hook-associated protein 1 FlgK
MSDLLSLLSLGSAGIAAQNTGVGVASNNVANVNTEGYSRQRVDLESLVGSPLVGGVRSGTPDRLASSLLGGRMRASAGSLAMSTAFSNAHTDLEARLVQSGPSLDGQLGTMMSRLQQVSAAPTDPSMREAVVESIRELVAGMRQRGEQLDAAISEANQRIRDNARAASDLAQQLADTNLAVAKSDDPVLRDHRELIAGKLSELVGGKARVDGDGQMRFVLDNGAVLVDGKHAQKLTATPDPVTQNTKLTIGTRDVATLGGSIGADLQFRDGTLATAKTDLDQLAFDMANQMNTVHAGNVGLDGTTGNLLFVAPTGVAGAAAALEIDPALDADTSKLATRGPGGGPGDNAGALALIGTSQTYANRAIDLVAKVATEGARARGDVTRDTLVNEHLAGLRDSLSGVDIQEELANLARFQHASSAMTSFVSTIDQMLGDLIDRL